MTWINKLYYGDCFTIMQEMNLGSVDLIYLDPPFNSDQSYNAIYKDETGRPLPDQVEAFCDQWTLNAETLRAIRHMPVLMREAGVADEVAEFWRLWMNALRKTNEPLLAYLSYMVQRLLLMKGILKPTGTIYLHCDPTASHYIKVMMDAIFGHDSCQNEIIWAYRRWPVDTPNFQRMHDVLFRYTRSGTWTWNQLYEPKSAATLKRFGTKQQVADFSTGKRLPRQTEDESNLTYMRDVWDIPIIAPSAKERMGYRTQKPLKLLDRIITASSNEGDVVFDPFCGCATTLEAAHALGRRWIGCDIAIHAIKRVARVRLQERLRLVEGVDFEIGGVPHNLEGARDLWEHDKYHFQKWAVEQVDGFVTTRRTGDGGIDGRLYYAMPQESAQKRDPLRSMILEVKGGKNVGISVVRDLRGVLEREEADMAGLIVMHDPSERQRKSFEKEMAAAGDVDYYGVLYPRMQLLTVEEIIDGARFKTPGAVGRVDQAALPLS